MQDSLDDANAFPATSKPPPIGTPCSDCDAGREWLTSFRGFTDGHPALPLCGRCAYERVKAGENMQVFDLCETPEELLGRVVDVLRPIVHEALRQGHAADDLVGGVSTHHRSGGHYGRPVVSVGPRTALARDLDDRAEDLGALRASLTTRRARRAAERDARRTVMRTLGGAKLARPAPTGSIRVVVMTPDHAAVLTLSLGPTETNDAPDQRSVAEVRRGGGSL